MGVTNRRPSSDSELISRMEMRFLACVTRGPSRDPYQTVSRKNIEGGWGIRTNSPKSYLVKFSGGNFFGLISSFSGRATEVRSQKTVLTSLESSRRPLTAWNTLGYCLHDWFDLLDGIDCTPSVQKQWQTQRAKKVVFDSPGLVDFAIGLVFFGGKIQITEGL